MLRYNLWTEAGLVNGAMGTVIDIVYHPDAIVGQLPIAVLVQWDEYTGPSFLDDIPRVVPIVPIKAEWFNGSMQKSRVQLPLCLAWAITIHKSQDQTLDKAVIDVGDRVFASGSECVAISRVRTLNGLALVTYPKEQYTKKVT